MLKLSFEMSTVTTEATRLIISKNENSSIALVVLCTVSIIPLKTYQEEIGLSGMQLRLQSMCFLFASLKKNFCVRMTHPNHFMHDKNKFRYFLFHICISSAGIIYLIYLFIPVTMGKCERRSVGPIVDRSDKL